MKPTFRMGMSPDFYVDAKGKFERVLEEQMRGSGIEFGPMPPQPGKLATAEALNQFDAICSIALKIRPESLRGVDRLALVARWGVGYDMIDVDALTEADIALTITPAGVRRPVAEAILTMIFALLKGLFRLDRLTRAGGWRGDLTKLGRDIPGHVLGSVGCGNIGRELFRLARPLGFARLIACDPYVRQDEVAHLGVELVDQETVFRESDIVSINCLLNAETRGMIGAPQFASMKPSAYFVNTARGPIVDYDALRAALREGRIAGAGLDVFPVEPPPLDDPLLAMENVIVTPHALGWTEEVMHDNGMEACRSVLSLARGELPGGIVNREVVERAGFQKKLARWKDGA